MIIDMRNTLNDYLVTLNGMLEQQKEVFFLTGSNEALLVMLNLYENIDRIEKELAK